MNSLVGRLVGLGVLACLVLVSSTTATFVLSADEFRDRASRFDTSDVSADSVLYYVEVRGRRCAEVTPVEPARLVRSEATCIWRSHPVRAMVFETAYDLTEKLNDGSLSKRCVPSGTRYYVLDGLVLLRTTDRRLAASLAELTDGFSFTSRCQKGA